MFREIKKMVPPLVIRGNLNDPYLLHILKNFLTSLYTVEEITKENFTEIRDYDTNYLFVPAKPRVFLMNTLMFPGKGEDFRKLSKKKVVFLENFNMDHKLDIPLIKIPRLKPTKKTAKIISDYCDLYLGQPTEVEAEIWKQIYSPSFSVLKDIEKTILAYGEITVSGFNDVTLTSPVSIQVIELLKNILEGSLLDSIKALEVAWESGMSLEKALTWFGNKAESYLENYAKGLSVEASLIEIEVTGNLKKIFNYVTKQSANDLVSRIWFSLSNCYYYKGRTKDIMLLLYLFNLIK